ncbi:unnamed protein product, partial [Enterobius vermicularis]|uniref:Phlebovirus_G2 domain-containing protein n=1 Tax=Enterobius vermicularis TaxID=51028 RepID=A0A0N4V424_ENTVE
NFCNHDLPFPVARGNVKCVVSSRSENDTLLSNTTCSGTFCRINKVVFPDTSSYYTKGCVSVNDSMANIKVQVISRQIICDLLHVYLHQIKFKTPSLGDPCCSATLTLTGNKLCTAVQLKSKCCTLIDLSIIHLQVGYINVMGHEQWYCDEDYCNRDIRSAERSIEAKLLAQVSSLPTSSRSSLFTVLLFNLCSIFLFHELHD